MNHSHFNRPADAEVRRDQEAFGRQVRDEREAYAPLNGRRITVTTKHARTKSPGHEAVLRSIHADGREINVEKLSGDLVVGTLAAFDKYTLTVKVGDIRRVIFKHDISEFYGVEPKKEAL